MNNSNDNKALQDLVNDLQAVIDGGKIEDTHIRLMVDEMLKQKALEQHENSIWQGTNGYWYTYINGDNGKRRLVKKKSQMDLTKVSKKSPTSIGGVMNWIVSSEPCAKRIYCVYRTSVLWYAKFSGTNTERRYCNGF